MARPCSVCGHTDREAIDEALLTGESLRNIAVRFGLKTTNLFRHSKHLSRSAAYADVQHLDLWKQLTAINSACLEVLRRAQQSADERLVLLAVDRVQRQLELSARLLGQLDGEAASTTVNVQIGGEWPMLRQHILGALGPFPEAQQAVLVSLNGHAH